MTAQAIALIHNTEAHRSYKMQEFLLRAATTLGAGPVDGFGIWRSIH